MSSDAIGEVSSEPKPAFGSHGRSAARSLVGALAAATAWVAVAALTAFWPDTPESDWAYTTDFAVLCGVLGLAVALASIAGVRFGGVQRMRRFTPWLIALALFLAVWEVVTAKLGLLPLPFFPPPQAILEVVIDDRARLGAGIFASFRLLGRVRDRGGDRMVAARRLLDSPDLAVHRTAAGDSLVAAGVFRIS